MNLEHITIAHVFSGGTALLLGLIGMFSPKRRGLHTINGFLFHFAIFATCLTAAFLAFASWDSLWWLFGIALLSYIAVVLGHTAARVRWRGWLPFHIICLCSAYISMTTAFLVVNRAIRPRHLGISPLWSWVIPTIIGAPLIAITVGRYSPGRRRSPNKTA